MSPNTLEYLKGQGGNRNKRETGEWPDDFGGARGGEGGGRSTYTKELVQSGKRLKRCRAVRREG